jgi:hypothetical protein
MGFLYLRKLLTIFVFKGVGEEVLYGEEGQPDTCSEAQPRSEESGQPETSQPARRQCD